MKRRRVLAAAGATMAAGLGGLWLRPGDNGEPYNAYFRRLNEELQRNGPMRPVMVIDLDRVDYNLALVTDSLAKTGKHYRIVEKSLPSMKLLDYVSAKSGSKRFMSFHQPFLNHDARNIPDADLLLGKPLPIKSAEEFYARHRGTFDPSRQLQWLIDTPQRLQQYLELANRLGTSMLVNVEIDVGLHRGGVDSDGALIAILDLIHAHPEQLTFSGFMGYDAHVGAGVPGILGSPEELLDKAMASYQHYVDLARQRYPAMWQGSLTLNTGGSPSYRLHERESLSTEVSVGTALLKPSHYDLATLEGHRPAAFIATPVLKAEGPIRLPALDDRSAIFSWWDVNQRQTYFVYGGYWRADYEAPQGLQFNANFGHSANQEIVNGSPATNLRVDDHVFLRPMISESVLLEFGDLLVLRGGKIIDQWPVMSQNV
jgi:D-serine deaminase-like pyridoxal phosphate-dependent protein